MMPKRMPLLIMHHLTIPKERGEQNALKQTRRKVNWSTSGLPIKTLKPMVSLISS